MQHNKYKIVPTKNPKKVAIIGGGIGGMECALVLKKRGHKPVLFEKTNELGGLFLTALVAATLLPAQSELLLGTLLVQSGEPAWALITVATLGNSAGSAVNWWLGRYLTRFQDRRWFPFSPESLRKAEGWYHRYGRWTLLCSWMPVIGDPLTLVAGTLHEPLPSFLLLVVLAKLGRYLVVAGVAAALW